MHEGEEGGRPTRAGGGSRTRSRGKGLQPQRYRAGVCGAHVRCAALFFIDAGVVVMSDSHALGELGLSSASSQVSMTTATRTALSTTKPTTTTTTALTVSKQQQSININALARRKNYRSGGRRLSPRARAPCLVYTRRDLYKITNGQHSTESPHADLSSTAWKRERVSLTWCRQQQ